MDFSEVRTHLVRECQFPIDHDTLVERVGDVALDAPTAEAETLATVLERTDETTYRSVDDVHATLVGTVGDAYVGRKFYDDRSGARPDLVERASLSV